MCILLNFVYTVEPLCVTNVFFRDLQGRVYVKEKEGTASCHETIMDVSQLPWTLSISYISMVATTNKIKVNELMAPVHQTHKATTVTLRGLRQIQDHCLHIFDHIPARRFTVSFAYDLWKWLPFAWSLHSSQWASLSSWMGPQFFMYPPFEAE